MKRFLFPFLLTVSVFAATLISMPKDVSAVYTFDNTITCYSIYPSQKYKTISVPPWHMVEVYFRPMKAGIWNFFAWHTNYFLYDKICLVSFSWRNGPFDTWHKWRNSTFGYNIWTHQHLYSGSSNIEYKFEFCQFEDVPIVAHITIE